MIILRTVGGLGNQMIHYAFYRQLIHKGYIVKLDINDFELTENHGMNMHNGYELQRVFPKVIIDYASKKERAKYFTMTNKILRKFGLGNKIVQQTEFYFDKKYFNLPDNVYLVGDWGSEKYFSDIFYEIRQQFTFSRLDEANQLIANAIENSNSVSIHVRRGDYVGHSLFDGVCNLEYYKKAIEFVKQNVANPTFFIFSNDLDWCRVHLKIANATFITGNTKDQSYIDMQLMSLCKHNIIANSSFSWWAAWLNNNKEKLILCPQKFFNGNIHDERDIYPETWIKIANTRV